MKELLIYAVESELRDQRSIMTIVSTCHSTSWGSYRVVGRRDRTGAKVKAHIEPPRHQRKSIRREGADPDVTARATLLR